MIMEGNKAARVKSNFSRIAITIVYPDSLRLWGIWQTGLIDIKLVLTSYA